LPKDIDVRKLQLFRHIFESDGEVTIKDLSEKIFWSERQINRYFKQQLGIPLKSYCNILRFQASLPHIKSGQLYPQLNYTDQSHFIKEIKKLSGVSPKELFKNENDRFLQFLFFNQK
jgi:AraC-like DNA-binding protein